MADEHSWRESEKFYRLALTAIQKSPDRDLETKVIRGLVSCAYELGEPDDGRRWFNALVSSGNATAWDWESQGNNLNVVKRYKEAGDAYRTGAELGNGYLYKSWCEAADNYWVASDPDLTLSSARKCIEEGTGKEASESILARAHQVIASVLSSRGVYSEALSHAKEGTALDPSNSFAFDSLAEALLGLHRFNETANAAQQAIRLSDGKFGWMHFRLGSAYFSMENWEFALQSFQKAAELDPSEPASAYNVALCNQRLRYFLDAARWYEEYLRRKPDAADKQEILRLIQVLRNPS